MTNRNQTYFDLDADLTPRLASYANFAQLDIATMTAADIDTDYIIDTDITDDDDKIAATYEYLDEYLTSNRDEIIAAHLAMRA